MISDEEALESGAFLDLIKQETERAMKERHYLMKELKAKERRGSIFIDHVKRVVAAIQRESGKYDYLIEWEYNSHDHITPSTTLVRGSHFAFSNPLLFRRYLEKHFVEARECSADGGFIIKRWLLYYWNSQIINVLILTMRGNPHHLVHLLNLWLQIVRDVHVWQWLVLRPLIKRPQIYYLYVFLDKHLAVQDALVQWHRRIYNRQWFVLQQYRS